MRIKIKDIIFMTEQKPIEITVDARGVRLDVYVEDEANTVYTFENQCLERPVLVLCDDTTKVFIYAAGREEERICAIRKMKTCLFNLGKQVFCSPSILTANYIRNKMKVRIDVLKIDVKLRIKLE